MSNDSKNDIKNSVLTDNTAQSVYKHLRELESNRAHVVSRWIWELLQNARDAAPEDGQLMASVERRSDTITFFHNGRGFRETEIAHLIYHGSTKSSDDASLGQFGSGFLTTHLLSPKIAVAGYLEDGRSFAFELARPAESSKMLRACMDAAWNSFAPSKAPLADPLPVDFSTRFRYPITTEDADAVVTEGLQTLRGCAPLVLTFNPEFCRVSINDYSRITEFAVTDRRPVPDAEVTEVTVIESCDDTKIERRYLLIEGEGVAVALRVESSHDVRRRCMPQEGPRLYLGFPLVGTDQFSLPTVANSFKFGPTEHRDGIYLGQAEGEVNQINQRLIETALALHVRLIRFVAANGYADSAILALVPPVKEQNWLKREWLQQAIQEGLIEPICKTPSVVRLQGDALAPRDAVLPYADEPKQVLELRSLLEGMKNTAALLPSPEEAAPWRRAVTSWMEMGRENSMFEEAWDGRKLAETVSRKIEVPNEGYGSLEYLRTLLVDQDGAVEWLNKLCGFLWRNGLDDTLGTLNLVLAQDGYLDKLSNLYRDVDIDEELKQIADDLLDIGLRAELRDVGLTSLSEAAGRGDYENTQVVRRILDELRKPSHQGEADGEKKPKDASGRLLAWMVRNNRIDEIDHFPVWAGGHDEETAQVIWLERSATEDGELPLAPIQAWPSELREFADLFPRSRTLAESYFECLPEMAPWEALAEQNLLRTDIVLRRNQRHNFKESPPDEPLADDGEEHVSTSEVELVDVAYWRKDRIGVMSRVPDSTKRAGLLWRFLTNYMIPKDTTSVDAMETDCECGERHRYYRAAWLTSVVRNNWVRLGEKKRTRATPQSLAGLQSTGTDLAENDHALKLLSALGVTQLELRMESLADGDEARRRSLDRDLARILTRTGGDLAPVSKFVDDMQSDDGLLKHLDERRERRRINRSNQELGAVVELLVKEGLESEGFDVRRTGIGSDYEVEHDTLDEAGEEELAIKVARADGGTWLVEVKATRGTDVRMTLTQAKMAVEKGDEFLLCVVPVDTEADKPEPDRVRLAMRFVKGIGRHLGSLCEELDKLEKGRLAATAAEAPEGVRLEVVGGKARVCVDNALWSHGVPLDGLVEALSHSVA